MNLETFFESFAQLAEAPNGVQKLRELILQLAVQGKLVTQDANDEPASVLLAKIKAEKERLIQEKKIRKSEPLPPIEANEVPFDLPQRWEWINLGNLGTTQTGTTPSTANSEFFGTDFSFIKPADITSQGIRYDNEGLSVRGIENGRLVPANSVLMVSIGGSIGKVGLVDRNCSCNQQINYISLYAQTPPKFIFYVLLSPYFQTEVFSRAPSTTLPILSKGKWEMIPIPLPPLAEQHRIVAKVEQLMALCDELEAKQQKQQTARVKLNNAALDRLLMARAPEAFAEHWQRLCDNFDLLYDAPETVSQLRQAVLQLAVQGKLVPQDANDEPAAVLLAKIKAEKERLVQEKKIRKSEPLPPIDADEAPFDLPQGWIWGRMAELGNFLGGGTPSKANPSFWSGNIPWVSPKDMKVSYISDVPDHISEEAIQNSSAQLIPKGSLLMVIRGMILAHSFPIAINLSSVAINQDMKALHFFSPDVSPYLLLVCRGLKKQMLSNVERSSHGTCRIDSQKIEGFPIPLPPLSEQHRIVAKVNQLMALCDKLEAKLRQAQTTSAKLMMATVQHLAS